MAWSQLVAMRLDSVFTPWFNARSMALDFLQKDLM